MKKTLPFLNIISVIIVLMTVLVCLVLPVAADEDSGLSENMTSPEMPTNITNVTAIAGVPFANTSLTDTVPEVNATPAPARKEPVSLAVSHPTDWYVSCLGGEKNLTSLLLIPEIGEGDTIHIWGLAGQTYEGGVMINASDVTVRRWEGSPAQPLITNTTRTESAFAVTADNATFCGLNISGNQLNGDDGYSGLRAMGTSEDHIQHLTVTDCTFTGNILNRAADFDPDSCGGGLNVRYADRVLVERTAFTANSIARLGGGAAFIECNDVILRDTAFTDNLARIGGGAEFLKCRGITVTDSTFTDNTGIKGAGGADFLWLCEAVSLSNTIFRGNTGGMQGGGARFYSPAGATLTDVTLIDNSASSGGGVFIYGESDATLDKATFTSTTFTNNSATQTGGGLFLYESYGAKLIDSTFTCNNATDGGGAFFGRCDDSTLAGITFTGNRATHSGGAINVSGFSGSSIVPMQHFTISDSTFTDNVVNGTYDTAGGALSAWYVNDLSVERTAFTGNSAGRYGGGTHFLYCNSSVLTDSTFTGNSARYGGGLEFLLCNGSTLANTTVTGNYARCGSGADFLYSYGPVRLTGSTFTSNNAFLQGGGARFYITDGSSATLTETTFTGNTAGFGGGAYFQGSTYPTSPQTVLTGITFVNNTGRWKGGGAWFGDCDNAMLTALSFTGNSADYGGGALFWNSDDLILSNATFSGNRAGQDGGGACFQVCNNNLITGSGFTGNRATHSGGAINITGFCSTSEITPLEDFTITDCTLTDNTAEGAEAAGGALSAFYVNDLSVERTIFTRNDASAGGGTCLFCCNETAISDCLFDNPTNLCAENSTGVLNTTCTSGTNIAGGPYLGGNLWLTDPCQNISEWALDADFDGICDEELNITGFGTDCLPLVYGRGTVAVTSMPVGADVHLDGVMINRTTDGSLYLPVGEHNVTVSLDRYVTPANRTVTAVAGETAPVAFALRPVPTPTPSPASHSSNGGHSDISAGAASNLLAGGHASFGISNSAIHGISVTAGEAIPEILVTVERKGLPSGIDAPADEVYEYDELTLYRTTDSAIAGATLNFTVSKAWLDEHGFAPEDVVLYRYYDGGWQALRTEMTGENPSGYTFTAESLGFSLFAIGASGGTAEIVAAETTLTPTMTRAALPESTPATTATTPQQSPVWFGLAASAVGMAYILKRRQR